MATSTHSLAARRHGLPALWHLLSLDAPTVAALWFVLAARSAHLALHTVDAAALAMGTWMLYAADRLLDARHGAAHLHEERHRFHGQHRNLFFAVMLCGVPLLFLLLRHMETLLLEEYLALGVLMAAYFMLVHATSWHAPKELAVGIVFGTAVFLPELLTGSSLMQAIAFSALCWLNCILIYSREHGTLQDAHWSTRLAIRHLPLLLVLLAFSGGVFCLRSELAFGASLLLSALSLLALHYRQTQLSRLGFRVATDAALLTPLLFLAATSVKA